MDEETSCQPIKHAFYWYFTLFRIVFRIIATVVFLRVNFLSVLFFTHFTTMVFNALRGWGGWDGMVIIGHKSFKSTIGANNKLSEWHLQAIAKLTSTR